MSSDANLGFKSKAIIVRNQMATSEAQDETVCYNPSYLDLHCLHMYLLRSAGLKGCCVVRYLVYNLFSSVPLSWSAVSPRHM